MKAFRIFLIFIFCQVANAEETRFVSSAVVPGAPTLNLVLNENYLITHAIVRSRASGKFHDDVIAFQNFAWTLNKPLYQQLRNEENAELKSIESDPNFLKGYSEFFDQLKVAPEYKLILKETQDYMGDSLREWDANLEKTVPFMQRYSGFDFGYSVDAYITHPALGNGVNWGRASGKKIISFGTWANFNNYFTVYIWHEIIHFHMGMDETSHAVNQLLTDNQLRVFLNGGSLMPLEGHPELMGIMEQNLTKWEEYKLSPTNLNVLVQDILSAKSK